MVPRRTRHLRMGQATRVSCAPFEKEMADRGEGDWKRVFIEEAQKARCILSLLTCLAADHRVVSVTKSPAQLEVSRECDSCPPVTLEWCDCDAIEDSRRRTNSAPELAFGRK